MCFKTGKCVKNGKGEGPGSGRAEMGGGEGMEGKARRINGGGQPPHA